MEATLGPVLMRKAATESFRVAAAGDDAELLSDAAGGEETASRGERFATEATAVAEPVTYDVSCHERSRLAPLYQRLKHDHRVVEVIKGESRLRLTVAVGEDEASLLSDLGRLEAVDAVELYVPPEPLLSFAAEAVVGGAGGGLPALKWRGEGQTIGIADSGIDAEHPDFQGRLTVVVRTPPLSDRDPRGHGTHVASIAAGDGAASGGKLAGLASKAKIFMQSLADENMQLQPGVDLGPLLDEAYQAGVRVQNFSWGSDVASRYTMNSKDVDAFVYDHQDMLIVVAGGNSGIQEVQGDPPRIALKSLAAPANAKNCLTVGASCSPRQDGPYANQTWNHFDGRSPPSLPPMSGLPLTGDPKVVAALSSRGPSDDGRLKPDLLAPGVGIAAARSADSTPNHPLDDSYCFMSGTSMAAPLVAGAAVVVRQYYMDERDHTPSAALLKATLINGADWLEGEVWEDSRIGQPNFHQGFGLFSLGRAIPLTDDGMALLFEDIGNGTPQALRNGKPGESGTLVAQGDGRRRHAVLGHPGLDRPAAAQPAARARPRARRALGQAARRQCAPGEAGLPGLRQRQQRRAGQAGGTRARRLDGPRLRQEHLSGAAGIWPGDDRCADLIRLREGEGAGAGVGNGSAGRIRTYDQPVNSRLLYH